MCSHAENLSLKAFFSQTAVFYLFIFLFFCYLIVYCLINFECGCVLSVSCFYAADLNVSWDLLSVWLLHELLGCSRRLRDTWSSLWNLFFLLGDAGKSLCLRDSGHVFGPTWQGEIDRRGGLGECE